MSIDMAVGRIDSILAMERQLTDPASAAGTTSAGISATASAATGSSGSTFGNALSTALATNNLTAAGIGAPAGVVAAAGAGGGGAQIQAMIQQADSLVGKPYVWGGGHGGWGPTSGYDCSGFVSAVLHAGGYLTQPADTTDLPNQPGILPGPGQYVTIYDRAQPGQNGHVIIEIAGQFYESGGETGAWGGGGGVEKIGTPPASYLATFPNVLHPSGL